MKTKVYILAVLVLAFWVIGGSAPEQAVGMGSDDPPAGKRDAKSADDGDSMAGPRNPDRRDPPPPGDDDEGLEGPRRRPGAEWRDRRGGRNGPRDRFRRDRMRFGDSEAITPELEEKILSLLEQHLPDYHRRLTKLKDKDERRYRGALRIIVPMMNEFMELQKDHPDMAEVVIQEFRTEREVRSLAKKYVEAKKKDDTATRTALETEFRDLMKRRHELQMRRRKFRLEDFRERLERERQRLEDEEKRIESDQAHFDEDLDRRLEALRKGEYFNAFGPPPGERRREGGFDGPPHRGGRRPDDMDRPPFRGRGRRGLDGPPRHRGSDDERPPRPDDDRPPRGDHDDDGPPPDDDLDI
ncbi:MAG TPA: hypothetical protein P5081_15175 [Phycisphaerae bacterium]|nr:hypothetical protein [Phycisphaerae bacterium]HRW54212.1 hypothetical protein [Phycisphaerae bacterium]